jgi:type 1 glutamine amidotransferase
MSKSMLIDRSRLIALPAALLFLLAGPLGSQTKSSSESSASVRPPDSRHVRTSITKLLGWQIGVATDSLTAKTLQEAAVAADALGLGFIEGVDGQNIAPDTAEKLDDSLPPEKLADVKKTLASLRLHMPAYRVATFPAADDARRKLFQFAKDLGVETIVAAPDPESLPAIDSLASEFGVNVALGGGAYTDPKHLQSLIQGRSNRIGVSLDVSAAARQGIKPAAFESMFGDRILALNLPSKSLESSSRGAEITQLFLAMARNLPKPEESPTACVNCSRPAQKMRPVFLAIGENGTTEESASLSKSILSFEKDVRSAMGYRVEEITKVLPIASPDLVSTADREKIEAAMPREPLAKPKKARKLLVIDLCPDGGYYHATIANANLAIQLMSKDTGAFQAVFSNDLNNLKYPKIREYDAVFLNSTVGEVFSDPAVLNGLIRFVSEGGGVGGLHGASYASMDVPEYGELIGAQDGPHHVETATLKIDDPNSPLTKDLGGKDFVYTDEFYHFLPTGPYSREKLHVLLSIDTAQSDMSKWHVRPDNDYGLCWIKRYSKGRVFNCALGHTPTLLETPALAKLVFGGIQFILGDLALDTTPSAVLSSKAQR